MRKYKSEDFSVGQIVFYKTKNNTWDRGTVTSVGEKFVFAEFLSGYRGAVLPEDLHKHSHTLPRCD